MLCSFSRGVHAAVCSDGFRVDSTGAFLLGATFGGSISPTANESDVLSQVLGAIAAGGVLYAIASGKLGFDVSAGFASNGFGDHSPGGYSLVAALITEIVMTAMFLLVIMGATDRKAPQGFAPIAIGLCLTLIHLMSIPVTNTSVNPARSTGVAVFVGGWAISQLWLFWIAPIAGAVIGAAIYNELIARSEIESVPKRTITAA